MISIHRRTRTQLRAKSSLQQLQRLGLLNPVPSLRLRLQQQLQAQRRWRRVGTCRRPDPQHLLATLLRGTPSPSDAASVPEHHAAGGDNAAVAGIRDPAREPAGTMLRSGNTERSNNEPNLRFRRGIRGVRRPLPRNVGADPRILYAPANLLGLAARQDQLPRRERRRAHRHDHPDGADAAQLRHVVPLRRLLPRERRVAGVVLGLAAGVLRACGHLAAGDVCVLHQDIPGDELQREEGGLVAGRGESDGVAAVPRCAGDG
jgi:hypothetical protein